MLNTYGQRTTKYADGPAYDENLDSHPDCSQCEHGAGYEPCYAHGGPA